MHPNSILCYLYLPGISIYKNVNEISIAFNNHQFDFYSESEQHKSFLQFDDRALQLKLDIDNNPCNFHIIRNYIHIYIYIFNGTHELWHMVEHERSPKMSATVCERECFEDIFKKDDWL